MVSASTFWLTFLFLFNRTSKTFSQQSSTFDITKIIKHKLDKAAAAITGGELFPEYRHDMMDSLQEEELHILELAVALEIEVWKLQFLNDKLWVYQNQGGPFLRRNSQSAIISRVEKGLTLWKTGLYKLHEQRRKDVTRLVTYFHSFRKLTYFDWDKIEQKIRHMTSSVEAMIDGVKEVIDEMYDRYSNRDPTSAAATIRANLRPHITRTARALLLLKANWEKEGKFENKLKDIQSQRARPVGVSTEATLAGVEALQSTIVAQKHKILSLRDKYSQEVQDVSSTKAVLRILCKMGESEFDFNFTSAVSHLVY